MELIRLYSSLIYFFIVEPYIRAHAFPVGPRFLSSTATITRLYYSNRGLKLDCLAEGNPQPVLKWFRLNGSDMYRPMLVQASEYLDVFSNGTLFIRPFRTYVKSIHSSSYLCRAENPAGSIQTLLIHLKPQIYETYEIDVKTPYGFEQSSVILSCDISPLSASLYIKIIGWLEKTKDDQIYRLDLRPRTKYNLLPNRNLIIHNLTREDDHRSYACLVRNDIDNQTRQSSFKSLRVRERSPLGPELSIMNHTEYQAHLAEVLELPCGIASISPNARITWRKDEKELLNVKDRLYNHSLILHVSAEDAGNYFCQVDDESIGQLTSMMSLKVHVSIECHMKTKQKEIDAGATLELLCSANGLDKTSTSWSWYHDSVLLDSQTDRYQIHNASRKHMGMYQCCHQYSPRDINACCDQIQIRVINSPPVIVAEQSNTVIVPSQAYGLVPIDFNCTIYADPIADIHLFKDGHPLPLSIGSNTVLLPSGDLFLHYPIRLTTIHDTGLYECYANNSFGSVSLTKHVNIGGQEPLIQPMKNLSVSSSQPFTLVCYASGQPNLHLQWIDTTDNRIVNASNASPILWRSRETMSKIFRCRAMNNQGQVSSDVSVIVQSPVRIFSITSNRTMRIHQRLILHCAARGDPPLELTILTPETKKLPFSERGYYDEKNVTMTIDDLDVSDQGLYQCYARNNYSEHRSIFEIVVQNVPNRIENLFVENLKKIYWIKPFDGHSPILHYLLRIRFRQGISWSNETVVFLNKSATTSYVLDQIMSRCTISLRIQAVNLIGSSLPSDAIQFETRTQELRHAPSNLTMVFLSSKSVTLVWQYPSIQICSNESIEFIVEIMDEWNQTRRQIESYPTTESKILYLKSFALYTFVVSARNHLGISPKSKPLVIRTLESVPLITVNDVSATLLNGSTVFIEWTIDKDLFHLLNGRFRTFSVSLYENYNMSTIVTLETDRTDLNVSNLHLSSKYYITVSVCNYFDCGPSSSALLIETTPASRSDLSAVVLHPVNKPLSFACPSLKNQSRLHSDPILNKTDQDYRCGSKLIHLRFYDKPSTIQANLHYTTSNEIGLKINYPAEIIESITINYKIHDRLPMNELIISPPLFHVRLTNLSCGTHYQIVVYASNEAGFSSAQSLNVRTEGAVPTFNDFDQLIEMITNESVILNLNKIIIHQCPILSYEIALWIVTNTSIEHLDRYLHVNNQSKVIEIDQLEPNQQYQIHLKLHSEAGENQKIISFRTTATYDAFMTEDESMFLMIIIVSSFLFTLVCCFITVFSINFFQNYWKRTTIAADRQTKCKPILYSAKKPYQSAHGFTVNNYAARSRSNSFASEDSQGNINPYAVTDFTIKSNHLTHPEESHLGSLRQIHSERCPHAHSLPKKISNDEPQSSSADSGVHLSHSHQDGFACHLHSGTHPYEKLDFHRIRERTNNHGDYHSSSHTHQSSFV